jgi:zinc transporter
MSEMLLPSGMELTSLANEPLPGLIWAFRIHGDGSPEALALDAPIDLRHDGWLWLHFNLADARASTLLKDFAALPAAAVAVLVAADGHQQLHADETCLYGIFADLICGLDGITRDVGFLHFALTERVLISGRRHALNSVETTRQALLGGCKITSVAALLELIIDHVITSIDTYADQLAEDMDAIEEELLGETRADQRYRLAHVRKAAVHLHRQLQGLQSLFLRCGKQLDADARPHLRLPAGAMLQRLQSLDQDIVAMRDRAHLLQEEVTTKIAEETNHSLHLLTILTTYFLPANLVAGIFGMNTKGLPFTDHDSGFLWSMLILVLSPVAIFVIMWRMRIPRR